MRITFSGTAATYYTPARACCGIVLQHDESTVMLDCGQGSMRQALRSGIHFDTVGAVLFSHLHQDHTLDLQEFLASSRFTGAPLPTVYGPSSTLAFVGAAFAYVSATPLPTRLAVSLPRTIEIAGSDEREVCGFLVRSEETPHSPEVQAFARRLSAGGLDIVYSGDTQPNPATMVPLSEGAHVLIHEAFSELALDRAALKRAPDARELLYNTFGKVHTGVRDAAAIARDAGVHHLVLTHLREEEDPAELKAAAADVFRGEITIAYDGLQIDL